MIVVLPKYLLLNVLKDWLVAREIGKLDSALCNRESRFLFLENIRQFGFPFSHTSTTLSDLCGIGLIKWIVSREINVKELSVKSKEIENSTIKCQLKDHNFNGLTHLRIACGRGFKSFKPLILRCPDLQSLEIANASKTTTTTICPILKLCTNIKLLSLTGLDGERYQSTGYMCVSDFTNQLIELRMTKCDAKLVSPTAVDYWLENLTLLRKLILIDCNPVFFWIWIKAMANRDLNSSLMEVGESNLCRRVHFNRTNEHETHFDTLTISSMYALKHADILPHITRMIISHHIGVFHIDEFSILFGSVKYNLLVIEIHNIFVMFTLSDK